MSDDNIHTENPLGGLEARIKDQISSLEQELLKIFPAKTRKRIDIGKGWALFLGNDHLVLQADQGRPYYDDIWGSYGWLPCIVTEDLALSPPDRQQKAIQALPKLLKVMQKALKAYQAKKVRQEQGRKENLSLLQSLFALIR